MSDSVDESMDVLRNRIKEIKNKEVKKDSIELLDKNKESQSKEIKFVILKSKSNFNINQKSFVAPESHFFISFGDICISVEDAMFLKPLFKHSSIMTDEFNVPCMIMGDGVYIDCKHVKLGQSIDQYDRTALDLLNAGYHNVRYVI